MILITQNQWNRSIIKNELKELNRIRIRIDMCIFKGKVKFYECHECHECYEYHECYECNDTQKIKLSLTVVHEEYIDGSDILDNEEIDSDILNDIKTILINKMIKEILDHREANKKLIEIIFNCTNGLIDLINSSDISKNALQEYINNNIIISFYIPERINYKIF